MIRCQNKSRPSPCLIHTTTCVPNSPNSPKLIYRTAKPRGSFGKCPDSPRCASVLSSLIATPLPESWPTKGINQLAKVRSGDYVVKKSHQYLFFPFLSFRARRSRDNPVSIAFNLPHLSSAAKTGCTRDKGQKGMEDVILAWLIKALESKTGKHTELSYWWFNEGHCVSKSSSLARLVLLSWSYLIQLNR